MKWINVFGLIFVAVMMIPNVFYFAGKYVRKAERESVIGKDGSEEGSVHGAPLCRAFECVEQLGRFGCILFMSVNLPGTWFGWWSDEAFAVFGVHDGLHRSTEHFHAIFFENTVAI